MRLRVRCSLVLNSSATLVYSAWRVLLERVAIFSPMFLIVLSIIRSSIDSVRRDPLGNGIVLKSRVLSSSVAWLVPGIRLTCSMLPCRMPIFILLVWICTSHRSFWMIRNICMYCFSNYFSTYVVVSLTLSPITSRSLSVNTMGSTYVLSNLFFFRDPPF